MIVAIEKTPPQRTHIPYAALDRATFTPVTLPKPTDERPCYFEWNDHGEATIYIDGVPYYGIDPAHRKAPLPAGVTELMIESTCLCTGIGVEVFQGTGIDEKGSTLKGANARVQKTEPVGMLVRGVG